jgi:hypothetical protein
MITNFPYARLRPGSRLQRDSASRFRHIADEGWYLQMREGMRGPFAAKGEAAEFLADFLLARPVDVPGEGGSRLARLG